MPSRNAPPSAPALTSAEWQQVRTALRAVSDCGCGDPAPQGSVRARLSHFAARVTGRDAALAAPVPAHLRPLRDFLCESERMGAPARRHFPALARQGYSEAQLAAMALIGA